MRIMVDMDEIVAGCCLRWLEIYNERYRDDLTIDDWKSWTVSRVFRNCNEKQAFDIIKEEGFFRNLPILPGAVEGIEELLNDDHDIYFCTQPASALSAKEKVEWVEEHFGHLGFGLSKMFQLPYKSWLVADLMIDDRPKTILKWAERIDKHPNHLDPEVMTIAYPFNKGVSDLVHTYAEDCHDTQAAWAQLVSGVREFAYQRKWKRS